MKRFMLLFLVFLAPALLLNAQDGGDDDPASMEDVVITATRTEQEILSVPQHVTVITAEDIEKSGVRDVAQILNRQAGLAVEDYGSLGSVQSLRMRGSTTEQVLVLLDGVRLNNAQSGTVDLSLLPVNNIERIEIVRGGTSALYGSDAVGGVVNIITRKEADGKLRLRVETGRYIPQSYVTGAGPSKEKQPADWSDLLDAQRFRAQYSRPIGKTQFTTSGSVYIANNSFIYKDDTGDKRKRENAGIVGGDATAAVRVPVGSGNLDVKGLFTSNKKGSPGQVGMFATPNAEQRDTRAQGTIGYYTDSFISDILTLNLDTFFNYYQLRYTDPDAWPTAQDSKHKVYSTGFDVSQEVLSFSSISFVYGANLTYDWVKSNEIGDQNRVFTGIFLQTPWYISGSFTLIPMIRYDYYSDFGGTFNYKLAINQAFSSSTSLKGSISKSFRAPTFNELYWPADMFGEGNPNLGPETGYSFDIGVTRIAAVTSLDVFVFTRYMQDVILWQEGDDFVWRPTNYGQGLYPGLETRVGFNATEGLELYADYTFIYTFALGDGYTASDDNRLPMTPVHELDVGLNYVRNRFSTGINGHVESKRYTSVDNTESLPSYVVLDAYYRQSIGAVSTFLLSVDNLLNKDYDVVPGYPMPGLFIRTGFEFEF
jgi:outer membrane cobalamin receptor